MSSSIPAFSRRRVSLHPNNAPSGNTYSATQFPQMNFVIARQPAFLLPHTLRLNGKFKLVKSDGTLPINIPNAAASATNGSAVNPRNGISSIFEEIGIQTLNGRNLETVRSYNRYLASSKPFLNNCFDMNNGLNLEDPFIASKSILNARVANVETHFSLPLEVGMFGDMPLNISEKGFHGLQLNLLLTENSVVSQPFFLYQNGVESSVLSTDTYQYELTDVFLTFDLIKPSEEFFNKLPSSGMISFNTIQSFRSTILASDTTTNLRFGCKNVISVTHSFLPNSHAINRAVNSFRLSQLSNNATTTTLGATTPIRQVQYMRAGELFPYNYILDSEQEGIDGNPQAMIEEPALNSVTLYDNRHSSLNPMSNVGINNQKAFAGANQVKGLPETMALDPESTFILGVPMDSQKHGANFKDREYAIRIQSGLDNTVANNLYTFVRCRNVAQYSPTGVNVIE